jgi:NADPH:quinone reductase
MKALICRASGRVNQLVVESVDRPIPGPGQVLVAMKAAGVNYSDALLVLGKYHFNPSTPFSPGSEFSGVVLALGESVTNVKVGQAVSASCRGGAFAEQVVVDATQVIPLPPGLEFDIAASFAMTYATTYYAIRHRGQLKLGETMLVLGAAGEIGLAAVRIGKALGAHVIAAASTSEKLAICQSSGADDLINYATEDLFERVSELTSGKGVDVICNPMGSAYAEAACRSIATGGRYLAVGPANGEIPNLPLDLQTLKKASVIGVAWGEFAMRQSRDTAHDLTEVFDLIDHKKLQSHISGRYPLENSARVLQDLLEGKVSGKVVITNCDSGETVASNTDGGAAGANLTSASVQNWNSAQLLTPAQLTQFVGCEIGTSSWNLLDQSRIDDFARCTGDDQWIHVDTERSAKESPFGTTVAHAFLGLSMIPVTLYELFAGKLKVTASLNYGLDKTRFMSPVKSGQRVRNRVTIVELEDKGMGRWLLKTENSFEIEGQTKPALVAVNLAYLIE